MTTTKQKKKLPKQSENGRKKATTMLSLNYDHELECKGDEYKIDMDSLGDKIYHPCTCSEIIDAKWQAEKDTQWNS